MLIQLYVLALRSQLVMCCTGLHYVSNILPPSYMYNSTFNYDLMNILLNLHISVLKKTDQIDRAYYHLMKLLWLTCQRVNRCQFANPAYT